MKRKLLVLLCVLAMASISTASVVVGDFEDSMDGWWAQWASATPVEDYSTLGDWSLEGYVSDGGWVLIAEVALLDRSDGASLQSGLGSVGTITLDATSFYNTGSSNDYQQICILINCGTNDSEEGAGDGWNLWTVEGYVGMAASGVAGSYTIQLSEDTMAAIASAGDYVNIGLLTNSSATETDEITGEISFDGEITTYFDNIQVVPEPATLALLGVGALSLIRRKR